MTDKRTVEAAGPALVVAFAFFLPVTISAAEGFAFLILIAGAWCAWQERRRPTWRTPLLVPALAYGVWALASLCWSVHPELGIHRLHRLLFLGLLWAIPTLCASRQQGPTRDATLVRVAAAFLCGAALNGVLDWFRFSAWVSEGKPLFEAGTMRDPQMLLTALCLAVALAREERGTRWRPFLVVAMGVLLSGLILHGKRGSWLAAVVAVGIMLVMMRRTAWVGLGVVIVVVGMMVPQIRGRAFDVADLRDPMVGGRNALWTEVAPALIPAHPLGMGWCSVTHDDLAVHTTYLQTKLNHLHNTALQITLELGWPGVLIWALWMLAAVRLMGKGLRRNSSGLPDVMGLALLAAFCALLINGVVEYNFGDTEVFLLHCLLMGVAIARIQDTEVPRQARVSEKSAIEESSI